VVWADPNPKGFQWSWYSGQVTDTTHLGEYAIPIFPLYILLTSMAFRFLFLLLFRGDSVFDIDGILLQMVN